MGKLETVKEKLDNNYFQCIVCSKDIFMAKKKSTNHYIDNKLFFEKMSEWKELVILAEENGDPKPPMTEYIGTCFIKIATNLAMKPNFMNYSFVDEMIGDASPYRKGEEAILC